MGGPLSLDAFAPVADPLHDRLAALAARVGHMAADCAAMMFPLPLPPDARRTLEAETVDAIAALLNEFGSLPASDRDLFQSVTSLALDRRLAHHAALTGGGA